VVLLVFSVILAPIGMARRTSRAVPSAPRAHEMLPSRRAYTGPSTRSGGLFTLGVSLVVLGIGVVAPSLLALGSLPLVGEGVTMAAFGMVLAYRGGRSS
jgi:hypothetical protein